MNQHVLVTGGNGFLGSQLIAALLTRGYLVTTTLRHLDRQAALLTTLTAHHVAHLDRLTFVQADLARDDGWAEAMQGIDYVLSVASPLFSADRPFDQVADDARNGTLRILRAAEGSTVKRIVMTANFGAVGFSHHDSQTPTTEQDWTDPNEPGLSPYEKSKLLAEQAAWAYVDQHHPSFEFNTVNPVAILGNSLDDHVSGSFTLIKQLIDGRSKFSVNLPLNVVNVTDVVDLHLRALFTPHVTHERFIATEDGQISMKEIVALIAIHRPALAANLPNHFLPTWLIRCLAPFSAQAKEGLLMLKVNRKVSNQHARELLDWTPLSNNDATILQTVDTLVNRHLI